MVQQLTGKYPPGVKDVYPGKSTTEIYNTLKKETPQKSTEDLVIDYYHRTASDVIRTKNAKAIAFFLTNASNEYKPNTTIANKIKLNDIFVLASEISSAKGIGYAEQSAVQAVSKQHSQKILELS